MNILVVRLGAMGDIIHTLPAVATLKSSFPQSHIAWAIDPRWSGLLAGNPYVDRIVEIQRAALRRTYRNVRAKSYEAAIDFQGLLKSAAVALFSGARQTIGFNKTRERAAALFYTRRVEARSDHVVDRNLELAEAFGATNRVLEFPLPPGAPESQLPEGPFVLASPLAGWKAKQWPLEYFTAVAEGLDMPVVLNGPPSAESELRSVRGCVVHIGGVAGLIHATRRAAAVIGVDSGPLHLAAALDKPGVAIYGPTDPSRNGPYGGSIEVLREPYAVTSYKRRDEIDSSMRAISPDEVLSALQRARPV